MKNNEEEKAQNKPKLDIKKLKNGSISLNYNGTVILMSKEEHTRLIQKINRLNREKKDILSRLEKQNEQFKNLKDQLEQLKVSLKHVNREKQKYKDKLEKFTSNQGKGRTPILTNEFKQIIKKGYDNKLSISAIYKTLLLHGFKGNYETVRKYIRSSEQSNRWL